MKKNVKEKKRILSLILAVVMVVTMMPMQAVAAATDSTVETTVEKTVEKNTDQTEKEQQPAKTGDEKDGDNPAVSVKWLPDTGEREDESKGDVQLEASLNKNGPAASADVEIRLDKEEADALAQFRNEEGQLDEAVKLTEEGLPEISLKKQENGDVHLCFTLDQDSNDLKQKIEFQIPENAEKDVEIEVTKEDVTVATEQKNDAQNGDEAEQVAFEFEGKILSLSVPEKAAQDDEKNTPNDEENNDKEQNAPVDEENNVEDESKQPSADGQEPAKEKKQLKMDAVFAAVRGMALSDLAGYEKTPGERETITQNIIWADNNDENNDRPTIEGFKNQYTLSYRMTQVPNGDVLQGALTESDAIALSVFKLGEFPATITKSGANRYKLEIKDLPTQMTYTDEYGDSVTYEIEWTIAPKNVAGYSLVNVTEDTLTEWDNVSSITEAGWYYMLNTDFSFNVVLRQGGKNGTDEIAKAVKDHFRMDVSCEGKNLNGVGIVKEPALNFNGSPTGVMTYQNVWKYNLDGARITYDVVEREGVTKDKIVVDSLDSTVTGDYFALTYDNSNSANYGSITNEIHENGTLYLTLTGKTGYEATKVWLDQGVEEKNRPTGEFQLWRYREGENYTTAAPVRDDKGDFYTCDLDTGEDSFPVKFDIEFDVQKELGLEKYDPEGYRYFYVSREYLNSTNEDGKPADNYEQVFGAVNEEGTKVTDRIEGKDITKDEPYSRDNTNTFLYNGGTLSNRITENVTVAGEKEWKAAAFQADFEDVTVVMTVQSRPKNSEDAWKNTNQSVTLNEFYAENLGSVTFSKSMPKYNSLGEELEYRWAETAVYQGENTKNLLEGKAGEDGEQYFTLKQNDEDVRYRSDSKTDGTNTVVTNTIANTVRYDIKKIWKNADGEETNAPEGAEVTFGIYRSLNGELTAQPVVEVTLDGVADEEPITVVDKDLGIDLTVQETSPWFATVNPLNEYDKEGHQYEYLLLETKNNTNFVPTYETIRGKDGKGKFYKTTVTNAPGKGNRILVSKEWTDDSDIIHREPVTIGVYVKEEVTIGDRTYEANEKIAETELNEGNVWFDWVGIGEIEPNNVYILETKVGNANVPLSEENPDVPQAPVEYDKEGYTAIQYDTENHKYEATYFKKTLGRETVYTVNNRRLGNVDLTVTKDWKDGNGAKRDALEKALEKDGLTLAVQLQFADHSNEDGYQITNKGLNKPDTISVAKNGHPVAIKDNSGENASSLQSVPFGNDAKIYFYNLPKYDQEGKVVNYDVEEVFVDKDGKILSWSDVKKGSKEYPNASEALSEYQNSYVQTAYHVGDKHDEDQQAITVTNCLQGSKDIHWHKQWRDDYTYTGGQRPDIYLNIYQVKHDGTTTLFQKDYKWAKTSEDKINYWTAELESVPKYDENGYEIFYYAVERTVVNAADFDYQDVQYAVDGDNGLEKIGTEFVPTDEATRDEDVVNVKDQEGATKDHYALKEEGTFTNIIKNEITIKGQKVWSSLPNGYKELDLPAVTFYVMRDDKGDEPVATLKVEKDQWADLNQNGSYIFEILQEDDNYINDEGKIVNKDGKAPLLPKYDANGKLYQYKLDEEVTFDPAFGWNKGEWTKIFQDSTNTYRMENAYKPPEGALKIKKFLYLPMGEDGKPEAYPAVKFELTRTYTGNNNETVTDEEFLQEIVWNSEKVEEVYTENKEYLTWEGAFENLELYAPNGSKYKYTVTEVKTELQGYKTWAVSGDMGVEDVTKVTNAITDLAPQKDTTKETAAVAATFKNQRDSDRTKVKLTGTKTWKDYNNAFGFRPEQEEFENNLKLTRYAKSQTGENNAIGSAAKPRPVDDSKYQIEWKNDKDTAGNDVWTYTIKGTEGSDELEKYAPNGMPWEYQIKEDTEDIKQKHYTVSPASGTVSEKTEIQNEITMNPLTNSIMGSADYQKVWTDSEGKTIDKDYLQTDITVTFKLEVKAADEWKPASEYFNNTLSDDDYKNVFGFAKTDDEKEEKYFTPSITAKINAGASAWSGTIENLPETIKVRDSEVKLKYRVVEASIKAGTNETTVTVVNGKGGGYYYQFNEGSIFGSGVTVETPNEETATTHTNILPTTDLTVKKVWEGDYNNAYGTRPTTGRGGDYTWETTLVIQHLAGDSGKWENVKVTKAGSTTPEDLTVTLTGTNNQDTVEETITGLPKTDLSGKTYQYRAREVKAGLSKEQKIIIDSDELIDDTGNNKIYNDTYEVNYDDNNGLTVTNKLLTTKIAGQKIWNTSKTNLTATLCLEYGVIKDGKLEWREIKNPDTSVELNGDAENKPADGAFPYYEKEAWIAVWEDLPLVIPGSVGDYTTDQGSKTVTQTQYRVKEKSATDGHSQSVTRDQTINVNREAYPGDTVTNTETTTYKVVKKWGGTPTGSVKVQLYRTTGDIGGANAEKVGDPIVLEGSGSHVFHNLPKYADRDNANITTPGKGAEYKYFAREIAVEIGDAWKSLDEDPDRAEIYQHLYKGYPMYTDTEADGTNPAQTRIVNVVKIDITGTKTWKDNENNYGTRPDELELVLYRQIEGGKPEKVEKVAPSWPNFDPELETWTYKYENLPAADKDGNLYTYSVKETALKVDGGSDSQIVDKDNDGYREANGGTAKKDNGKYNLTNTLTGKTSVTVEKVWRDGNDSNRGEIKVQLYKKNGDKVGNPQTLSKNSWTYTWKELPKYDGDGKLIEYTVKEVDEQDGIYQNKNLRYSVAYENEKENYNFNTTITNTKLTSLAVEKVWAGAEPTDSIEVGLYRRASDEANAVLVRDSDGNLITKTLSASQIPENNWKATFDDLPQFGVNAAGDEVKYTYYARELVTVNGEKEPLPGKITIVDNNNNRLPSGLYGVYHKDTEEGKTTITNVGLTSITGTKTWVDNGGVYEGTRPETLELTLSRYTGDQTAENAEEVKNNSGQLLQPTWKTDGDKWEYAYNNLPAADENGKLYTYIVKENLPEKTENGDKYHQAQEDYNLTNTLTGTVQVSVKKAWKDGSDTEKARPGEITIQLYKTLDGDKEEQPVTGDNGKVTLNSGNEWQHTWKELPKYEDGKLIHYTVKEIAADGTTALEENGAYDKNYIVNYGGTQADGYTITNTLVTSQTVTKLWEGDDEADLENTVDRPTNITAQLYAKIGDGEAKPVNGKTVELNKDSGWTHTWTNLPKYDGDNLIHYTVKELDADDKPVDHEGAYNDDYTAFYATDSETGEVTITNYHQPPQYMYLGQVEIRKDVVVNDAEGNPQPQKVTDTFYVALFEDEELTTMATDYDGNKAMKAIEFNGESSKTVTIDNMPVGPTTHPVTYYVAEVDKDGTPVDNSFKYQATVTKGKISLDIKHLDNKEDPAVITNAFGNILASIGGTKTWADEDASERPASIEVILQQNGQDYVDANGDKYIKTVTAADNWTYTFENLPEYDEDGKAYQYSVKEGYVDGYTPEVTGMDIRNIQDYEGYYYEGTVRITKQVLLKGDDYNVKDVYYAGIFNDKDYKDPLTNDDGSQYIVPLVLDDESETTVEITVPFNKADSAEYYITEVDENGVPVKDAKGLEYKASVKGGKVVLDTQDTEGDVTIVNSYDKEKKGNPNAPNTSDTPGGSGTQTGDNSNMTLLILTMLMALTLMGVLALGRKRKKS